MNADISTSHAAHFHIIFILKLKVQAQNHTTNKRKDYITKNSSLANKEHNP